MPAVVTKVYGTRNVNVRVVPNGPTWRRHIEQLRPRLESTEEAHPEKFPLTSQELEAPAFEAPGEGHSQRDPRSENPRRSERIRQRTVGRK